MNKKFLSAILFGALMITSTGTFVSCKDYDDDIENLQEQIDKKASLEELNSKVATLESNLNSAKSEAAAAQKAANDAMDQAEEAFDKAKAAADAAAGSATAAELKALQAALEAAEDALETAKNDLEAAIKKCASLEDVDAKIQALKEELNASANTGASEEQLNELNAAIDEVSAELMALMGHRLTSLAVIPTNHINGIAAITLTTLQYTPQKYAVIKPHSTPLNEHTENPVLDHVAAAQKPNSISTENNVAYFHVSPSVGVRTQDIEMPSFDCITSNNVMTRGFSPTENSPIKPVKYSIDKNILTVNFKKTLAGSIAAEGGHEEGDETFYMASLKAPIAKENYTADEAKAFEANGTKVYVNSEYVRLHEDIRVPYLVNSQTDFKKEIGSDFAVETQVNGKGETFYVHYHDSVCAYESLAGEFVDVKAAYDEPLDLKKLVTVCTTDLVTESEETDDAHNDHKHLANYKDYGLTFRFTIAKAAYNTLGGPEDNSNKTDQQKFAQIDNAMNGIMTSKVYTINGGSATAVGREPIVRVELVDTVNNALVAQRYLKVKWVRETGERNISYNYADSIYVCGNYNGRIGTQVMNEVIYHGAKEGGMTKQEFHSIYGNTQAQVSDKKYFDGETGKGEGTVEVIFNTEDGVESHNLLWTLTHKDIVAKYPVWSKQETMTFSKVCYWKDPTGAYPTLVITLTRTIYKPAFGIYGYDGRYWKNNGNWNIFNVNPIVYNTIEYNPAWNDNSDHKNNPTCNIYTDLLNGFLNVESKKPMDGAENVIYFTDKLNKCGATEKIPYIGVADTKHTHTGYAAEGVRFVFDQEKLEAANTTYKYDFYDKTKTAIVEKTATVKNNGTELWIGDQLAATIVNRLENLCTDENNPGKGGLTYNIKLEEEAPNHAPRSGQQPTEAAKALVGELVPIKLVADLCNDETDAKYALAHLQTIKAYDAFIIEPLTVDRGETQDFTDATIGGSTIDVKGAFTYVSWNADENGKKYVVANHATATALQKELWEFYEVVAAEWMTDQIKTNLKADANGNLVPTAGVENGPLPSNTTVVYEKDSTTGEETLTYNNYSGTPVNWDYKMFIPVKFGYKWKTFTYTFEVEVKKNAGTPAE